MDARRAGAALGAIALGCAALFASGEAEPARRRGEAEPARRDVATTPASVGTRSSFVRGAVSVTAVASEAAGSGRPGGAAPHAELLRVRVTRGVDPRVPAAGVEVVAVTSGAERSAVTDEAGLAVLDLVEPSATRYDQRGWAIHARAAGEVSVEALVTVVLDEAPPGLELGLLPARGALAVVVVDAAERPIAGARVQVEGVGPDVVCFTDALGRAEVRGLPEVRARLHVSAPGFQPEGGPCRPSGSGTSLRFQLARVATIECRLRVDGGPPPEDAWVYFQGGARLLERAKGGLFTSGYAFLRPGDEVTLGARTEIGGRPWFGALRTTLDGEATAALLELSPAGALVGRVLLHGADPASLWVQLQKDGFGFLGHADLAADGTFRLDDLPPGPALLRVGPRGLWEHRPVPWQFGLETPVELASGATSFAELDLARSSTLRVQIASEDWRGSFLRVRREERVQRTLVAGETCDVVLEGRPAVLLRGRVVDVDGCPVTARVRLTGAAGGPETDHSGWDGAFSFWCAPGRYAVGLDDDEDALARVAARRGVALVRCDPVEVDVGPGDANEVLLRVVDDAGGR